MIGASIALALQAAAPAAPALECALATPAGDALAVMVVPLGNATGAAKLVPANGSAWPAGPIAGGGGFKGSGDEVDGLFSFGSAKAGVNLQINAGRATLLVARSKLPRAYGYCRRAEPVQSPAAEGTMLALDPRIGAPAFDPARWPEDCSLISRSGRRARIDFTLSGDAAAEVVTGEPDLLASPRTLVSRRAASGGRYRFVGGGLSGRERLIVDPKTAQAVRLIEFETLGGPGSDTGPAVAICGYGAVEARPGR